MSGKRGTEEWNLETGANPEDQGCRGPPPEQHLPSIVQQLPYHAIAVSTAMQNRVTKTMSVAPPLGDNWSEKKSNSQAQLHLPALDLFWALLWVQHHLPPLDLTWTSRSWLNVPDGAIFKAYFSSSVWTHRNKTAEILGSVFCKQSWWQSTPHSKI